MLLVDKELAQKQVTTFTLINRSDSDWTRKGTANTTNPIHLNAPKTKNLSMTSVYCFGENNGYGKTMYVEGCPTIFVDDVYVDDKGNFQPSSDHLKADKNGWKTQKGIRTLYSLDEKGLDRLRKTAIQKLIRFDFGILSLDKYGNDPTLQKYVECHEDNINAPNAKFNKRNANKMWAFTHLQEEVKAAKKLDNLDAETEALIYVSSLRTKTKEGYTYTPANIAKIDATLRMLDMKLGYQEEDYNQKHLAIKSVAAERPVEFIGLITDEYNAVRMTIAQGVELKVLEMPSKTNKVVKMNFAEGKEKGKSRDLITASSDNYEEQVMELSIYFLTDKGTTDYRDLTLWCDAAKMK